MTPERRERLLRVLHNRQSNLTVVLENVEDPHNISAAMRTCDAVGIQDMYVLTNKTPRRHWGRRSSSSADKWLTIHQYTDVNELFAELRKHYDKIYTTHLSSDAVSLYDIDFKGSVALVFGSEHYGISEETRALADGNFIIPMQGIIRALNISVACAISIYEAMRQKMAAGHYDQPSLPAAQRETLLEEWGFKEEDL
jgi:tRNA (guanosine-2'-O-)-methyltransferase